MALKTAGSAGDYAEIIVDYRKKKVSMVNGKDNKPFKENRWIPSYTFGTFILYGFLYLLLSSYDLTKPYSIWFTIGIYLVNYILGITFYPAYKDFWKKVVQRFTSDYGLTKKLVIIKKLNKKVYSLPFEFSNNKCDWRLWGDFAKYISKVHIKPKDYYLKSGKNIEKQIREWDCFMYFEKIPKSGKMEIEFI